MIFNESLHHMPDAPRALAEAAPSCSPAAGSFFTSLMRTIRTRVGEVRDYFAGTVEKSFGVRQLRRLLAEAGFELVSLERHVCTASEWKLAQFNPVHRVLRKLYVAVSKRMLWLFGNLIVVAMKPAANPQPS